MNKKILSINDNFPIKVNKPIHRGKIRSVYWIDQKKSQKLIEKNNYPLNIKTPLAIMIISDKISAFDCIWKGENYLDGVPLKGAALNTLSAYWFNLFKENNLLNNHIVDIPHPYVWIVQKANVIKIEAILRSYITGSMWREYEKGQRLFCGNSLPEGLNKNQKLQTPLLTPSTKGILKNIPSVPEYDDVNIDRKTILKYFTQFNLKQESDFEIIEYNLLRSFEFINNKLDGIGQIFVDTKFEFGYGQDFQGNSQIIYIDEIATPDSSRFWDKNAYENGQIIENSKEILRHFLLKNLDNKILLLKEKMTQRRELAKSFKLPEKIIYEISKVYIDFTEMITKEKIIPRDNIEEEILDILNQYELLI